MTARLDYFKASPEAVKAILAVENHCKSAVDKTLFHLIKLRASQVNCCAFCIDMHWKEARAAGEPEHRLYGLAAWRESPAYTPRERAVLAWTEALTLISTTRAPDEDFAAVRQHFTDKELADLSWAIATINAWNRIAIGFRVPPAIKPA